MAPKWLIVTYLNYMNCCKNIYKMSFTSGVWTSFIGFPFLYKMTILPTCTSWNVTSSCISLTPKYSFSLWSLVRSILISVTVYISPVSLSWVTAISFIKANVLLIQRQTKSILHELLTCMYNIDVHKIVFIIKSIHVKFD